MVGGPAFVAQPELVSAVGADATASDAPHAVTKAETLVAARESRDAGRMDDQGETQTNC